MLAAALIAVLAAQTAPAEAPPKKKPQIPGGATGWVEPEAKDLVKLYGLRYTFTIDAPDILDAHPTQWVQPFISRDGSVLYGASDGGKMQAIGLGNGARLWKRDDLGGVGRGIAQIEDTIILGADSSLVGLEGYSGKELWRVDLGGVVGGEIVTTGTVAIVPVRPNGYTAVDGAAGKVLWRWKRPAPEGITVRGQPPAAVDRRARRVYVGSSDGWVVALGLEAGDVHWNVSLGKEREPFLDVDAGPILVDGGRELIAGSYNGGLARLEAASGRVVWKQADQLHLTALAAVPGAEVVVGSLGDGQVVGIDPATGKTRWRYKLDKGVPTAPVALGRGFVAVGSSLGPLAILAVESGKPLQLVVPGTGMSAPPFVRDKDLAIMTNKASLLALRYGEGEGIVR